MSTIQFSQVSLKFLGASHFAVSECSCEIPSGAIVVILGPSGCGKTTLLKMVNRLYEPIAGTIYLDGQDIRQISPITLRRRMGYVIQQSGLFPHMTVAQNIAVVPKLLGWQPQKIRSRIDELLHLVELPPQDYRDRYPSQLSGGQQQRIGLARALAADPTVMLMDEPFGAIDALTRTTLQDEILRIQRQVQKTILFVSHDVEEAFRLADYLLIMQSGKIVQYDTPLRILHQPANAFVRELLNTDDSLRHLSLLRVKTIMTPLPNSDRSPAHTTVPINPQKHAAIVTPDDTLRQALSRLLKTDTEQLLVQEAGKAIGVITLQQIRSSVSQARSIDNEGQSLNDRI